MTQEMTKEVKSLILISFPIQGLLHLVYKLHLHLSLEEYDSFSKNTRMFSRTCQYALQAVLYISLHGKEGSAVKSQEIADSQNIPPHFLGKILQTLVKYNVLKSIKGPTGGFILNEGQEKLTMLEIVRIIDGFDIFDQCGIGLKACSDENPCPIHNDYKVVKNKIRQLLSRKTITTLCKDVENGKSIVSFVQGT